jgi:HD-GYP domain-containing protein (c-di-GMP phosphodiesterase class II)
VALGLWVFMNKSSRDSFFSVAFDLILIEENLPYDLYINSSAVEGRDRFVRIFPMDGRLGESDLVTFKQKYHQLYIPELQRGHYLKSLVKNENASDKQKTDVIKGSAIHYLDKVFDKEKEYNTEVLSEAVQGCRESVESMIDVLKDYDVSQVQNLIGSLSFHDFYTYDHSINVSMYSIAIYKGLKPNASREELVAAGLGGLLHDLGKIKIPTHIINNPGKLTEEEFEEIKRHPDHGLSLLSSEVTCSCKGVDFEAVKRAVHEHHENYNGTGYPQKLKEDEIHLMARVTSIADFFDAITTKRSYNEVLSTEEALAVMERSVGRKIDPRVFGVFVTNVKDLVFKKKSGVRLPDAFDPCQPHNVLPFEQVPAEVKVKDFAKGDKGGFGKVVTQDSGFGKKKAS